MTFRPERPPSISVGAGHQRWPIEIDRLNPYPETSNACNRFNRLIDPHEVPENRSISPTFKRLTHIIFSVIKFVKIAPIGTGTSEKIQIRQGGARHP